MESISWSWSTVGIALGAWCLVSFAFALVVARVIRAGQRPQPEDQVLRQRSSGVLRRVDPASPEWAEMAATLEREAQERHAAEQMAHADPVRELRPHQNRNRASGE